MSHWCVRAGALVAAVALLGEMPAGAELISRTTANVISTGWDMVVDESDTGTDSASTSYTPGTHNTDLSALAATTPTSNAAFASVTTDDPSALYAYATAWSEWTDEITVTGGTGTGFATFQFSLDGVFSTTTGALMRFEVWAAPSFGGSPAQVVGLGANNRPTWASADPVGVMPVGDGPQHFDLAGAYEFVYDQPFTVDCWLYALAWGPGVLADFYHTAVLTELELPFGATLMSRGGTSYPVTNRPEEPEGSDGSGDGGDAGGGDGGIVPEPGTLLLVAGGLVALSAAWRRAPR